MRHLYLAALSIALILLTTTLLRAADLPQDSSVHRSFMMMYRDAQRTSSFVPAAAGYSLRPLDRTARNAGLKKEVFGYLPYWFASRWGQLSYRLISTIAYFSGEIAANGAIGDTHGWPAYPGDPSAAADVVHMINAAHANGVKVVLCFTNFSASEIDAIISTPAYQTTFIQQSLAIVKAGNGDGININFEGINSSGKAALTQFMIALADSFHANLPGSQVSCAPTDYDTRAGDWDLVALNAKVDLFFFQGYGYGWSGISRATPVGLLTNTAFWGSLNITTLIDFVLARIPATKVVLGVPHFGYRWPTLTGDLKATTTGTGVAIYYPDALGFTGSYGRLWDQTSLNPWFRYQAGSQWYEGWYDDPESMSHKYQFVLDRNLMGVGMWSLGMDAGNKDIWNVLASYMSDSGYVLRTPAAPVLALVKDTTELFDSRIVVRWKSSGQPAAGGFRLYLSQDLAVWPAVPTLDESALGGAQRSVEIGGLIADVTYYVRMVAVDSMHIRASDTSDTYAVRTGVGKSYLIVDGFDRTTGSYNLPRHDFGARYGDALASSGVHFDCADNESIQQGMVQLSSYDGVVWFVGDESTADLSLNSIEQVLIQSHLQSGGRLFITGSELGYDLGRSASPNYVPLFYANYLKAVYGGDKAATTTYSGASSSAFVGIAGSFGTVYPEDYPDYITAAGGSQPALMYSASQVAAVQYEGTFGTGTAIAKLVYAGFAVETIGTAVARAALMSRVVGYFGGVSAVDGLADLPATWSLSQNYPNPFNPSTFVTFTVPQTDFVSLKVYDVLGREISVLVSGQKDAGMHRVTFDASHLPSGVYLCVMRAGEFAMVRKMTLVR
jgi:spore germination protein YaaH